MQFLQRRPRPAKWPDKISLDIAGAPVDIGVRVNARARSYRLSLDKAGRPVLTVPAHGRCGEAEAFVLRHRAWLAARLKRAPVPRPFIDGALIPLRDLPHRIVATGRLRGTVALAERDGEAVLLVPGASEHFGRRLTDWLKKEAKRDLTARVAMHAATLHVHPTGLTLRGQSSRWGSCSSGGRLSFNWRLVLAPPFVLDYVAAHEVAHLSEMNHSPAFWAEVGRALPDYQRGRAWIKAHGGALMVVGLDLRSSSLCSILSNGDHALLS